MPPPQFIRSVCGLPIYNPALRGAVALAGIYAIGPGLRICRYARIVGPPNATTRGHVRAPVAPPPGLTRHAATPVYPLCLWSTDLQPGPSRSCCARWDLRYRPRFAHLPLRSDCWPTECHHPRPCARSRSPSARTHSTCRHPSLSALFVVYRSTTRPFAELLRSLGFTLSAQVCAFAATLGLLAHRM